MHGCRQIFHSAVSFLLFSWGLKITFQKNWSATIPVYRSFKAPFPKCIQHNSEQSRFTLQPLSSIFGAISCSLSIFYKILPIPGRSGRGGFSEFLLGYASQSPKHWPRFKPKHEVFQNPFSVPASKKILCCQSWPSQTPAGSDKNNSKTTPSEAHTVPTVYS